MHSGRDVQVMAYNLKQAMSCGEKRCEGWTTSQPGTTKTGFSCMEKPIHTVPEPDHWYSGLPIPGVGDVTTDWHLPLCHPLGL